MAYADQPMSRNKVTALIIVALIHIALGYALVTGLAYEAAKKAIEKVTTVDIKEEKKEEEPPPPPPKEVQAPPPPVAPPVKINIAPTPPQIQTVTTPPPPAPVFTLAAPPPAPPAPPPAPPAPPAVSKARGVSPKGQSGWARRIQDNYPARALRDEREGRVGVRVTVGPDGRVTACSVTSPSGSPDLDSAACSGMQSYARFDPALDAAGNGISAQWSTTIVYQIN